MVHLKLLTLSGRQAITHADGACAVGLPSTCMMLRATATVHTGEPDHHEPDASCAPQESPDALHIHTYKCARRSLRAPLMLSISATMSQSGGLWAKETIPALTEQQVEEWTDEVDCAPDHDNPEHLLDQREIILKNHHRHEYVPNHRDKQAYEHEAACGKTSRTSAIVCHSVSPPPALRPTGARHARGGGAHLPPMPVSRCVHAAEAYTPLGGVRLCRAGIIPPRRRAAPRPLPPALVACRPVARTKSSVAAESP